MRNSISASIKRLALAAGLICSGASAWAQVPNPSLYSAPFVGADILSAGMAKDASNATNPTALSNLTGAILSYSGSTLSLQSGKTLDLSAGTTTLPGSGQISSAGEIGLGASATALLSLGGTYTTGNAAFVNIAGTLASSLAGALTGFVQDTTISPTGSATTIRGTQLLNTIDAGALNFVGVYSVLARTNLSSGYSGTITTFRGFAISDTINSGSGKISTFRGFEVPTLTNGNGITTGTVTNQGFYAQGITAGAAGGTANNRSIEINVPSGGASSGTANNRGLYITGPGGSASGGTVNNFAIYSDSTANSRILGFLGIGGDPSAQLHLQGNISAAAWTTNGIKIRGGGSTLTDTSSSGTVAAAYTNSLGGNTIAASNATTFTNYYSLYLNAPIAGSNVTMTNKYAFGADTINSPQYYGNGVIGVDCTGVTAGTVTVSKGIVTHC